VLVLEEPTAHLDLKAAEQLIADILSVADGRIAHRPEGLDLVVVVVFGDVESLRSGA
jgi:ABC-type transport system involved in cytochrome bd biosynthesis fused ATPase/permease subunit